MPPQCPLPYVTSFSNPSRGEQLVELHRARTCACHVGYLCPRGEDVVLDCGRAPTCSHLQPVDILLFRDCLEHDNAGETRIPLFVARVDGDFVNGSPLHDPADAPASTLTQVGFPRDEIISDGVMFGLSAFESSQPLCGGGDGELHWCSEEYFQEAQRARE